VVQEAVRAFEQAGADVEEVDLEPRGCPDEL
jgi:hypothetical protein